MAAPKYSLTSRPRTASPKTQASHCLHALCRPDPRSFAQCDSPAHCLGFPPGSCRCRLEAAWQRSAQARKSYASTRVPATPAAGSGGPALSQVPPVHSQPCASGGPLWLGGLRLGCCQFLGVLSALLAAILPAPLGLAALPKRSSRITEPLGLLIGHPQQIEIGRLSLLDQFGGLFQLGHRVDISLPLKIRQAQTAVGHGELLVLGRVEFLFSQPIRLLHRGQQLDCPLDRKSTRLNSSHGYIS